eukprot:1145956-Pelagomonas_calceolata.AAC.2
MAQTRPIDVVRTHSTQRNLRSATLPAIAIAIAIRNSCTSGYCWWRAWRPRFGSGFARAGL